MSTFSLAQFCIPLGCTVILLVLVCYETCNIHYPAKVQNAANASGVQVIVYPCTPTLRHDTGHDHLDHICADFKKTYRT